MCVCVLVSFFSRGFPCLYYVQFLCNPAAQTFSWKPCLSFQTFCALGELCLIAVFISTMICFEKGLGEGQCPGYEEGPCLGSAHCFGLEDGQCLAAETGQCIGFEEEPELCKRARYGRMCWWRVGDG